MKIQIGDKVRQASYPEGTAYGPVLTVTAQAEYPGPCGEQAFFCDDLRLTTLCAVKVS